MKQKREKGGKKMSDREKNRKKVMEKWRRQGERTKKI
jgi:hypothetical protein